MSRAKHPVRQTRAGQFRPQIAINNLKLDNGTLRTTDQGLPDDLKAAGSYFFESVNHSIIGKQSDTLIRKQ